MKQANKSEERVTAFALGEMQGPEKDLFEKDLDANVAIQNEVNDIKNFTNELRLDLGREGLSARDARLHKNLMNRSGIEGPKIKRVPKKPLLWSAGVLAAAAVAAVVIMPRMMKTYYIEISPGYVDLRDEVNVLQPPVPEPAREQQQAPSQILTDKMKMSAPQSVLLGRSNNIKVDQGRQSMATKDSESSDEKSPQFNTEAYDLISENPFKSPGDDPLSTFSVDVDTASYANIRRFAFGNELPPKDAVRIEEMVNYFPYAYKAPEGNQPFAVDVEVAQAPWKEDHRLVKIGIKAKDIEWGQTPASNLVFLIDISGSMEETNKLPLLKKSLKLLVEKLGENDRVAIVVYAGASGLVLPSTSATQKQRILDVLEKLSAGGSTNGGEGIELAYSVALQNYIKGGINRVIVATDGDFNMGVTSEGQLSRLIEEKAKSGVFLSVLGFGMGNYKDASFSLSI